jgi:hypothetical protein
MLPSDLHSDGRDLEMRGVRLTRDGGGKNVTQRCHEQRANSDRLRAVPQLT